MQPTMGMGTSKATIPVLKFFKWAMTKQAKPFEKKKQIF